MTTEMVVSAEQQKAIESFNKRMGELVAAAEMPITDQASLVRSGDAKVSLQAYEKAVKAHFAPEIEPLDEKLKKLKNQVALLLAPAKAALDNLVTRQRNWMAEEKRKAEAEAERKRQELARAQQQKAEEDRRTAERAAREKRQLAVNQINSDLREGIIGKREAAKRLKEAGAEEEAAKQTAAAVAEEEKNKPAPEVRVVPAIPKAAGVRNQTFFYAMMEGETGVQKEASRKMLVQAFATACELRDDARVDFLQRFITVDETEVSRYAREMKDPQAVMGVLPGVRAWGVG